MPLITYRLCSCLMLNKNILSIVFFSWCNKCQNFLKLCLITVITLTLASWYQNKNSSSDKTVTYNITKDIVIKLSGEHLIEASLSKEVTKEAIGKIAKNIKRNHLIRV